MELQIDDLLIAIKEGSDPFPGLDGWEIDYYTYKLVFSWDPEEDCWKVTTYSNEE